MKGKKILAGILAGAMVLGSVAGVSAATVKVSTTEWKNEETDSEVTLESSEWWTGVTGAELTADSEYASWYYCIYTCSDVLDFGIEVYDAEGKYITTLTNGAGWYANASGDELEIQGDSISSNLEADTCYYVVIDRYEADFVITYYDSDYETALLTFTATNTDIADEASVHFYAQYGSFEVSASVSYEADVQKEVEVTELTLDETTEVTLSDHEDACYSYTPKETGYYQLSSSGDSDPCVYLYEEDDVLDSYITYADDNNGLNFILTYKLEAGATYYFMLHSYNWDDDGNAVFDIILTTYDPLEDLDVTELTLNETTEVTLSDYGCAYYSYTPEETGYYQLSSFGDDYDPRVYLYEDVDEFLSGDYITNADDEDNYNFILTYKLEAGTTYYFEVDSYTYDDDGNAAYDIILTTEPSTDEPSTDEPSTDEPSTDESNTEEASTTESTGTTESTSSSTESASSSTESTSSSSDKSNSSSTSTTSTSGTSNAATVAAAYLGTNSATAAASIATTAAATYDSTTGVTAVTTDTSELEEDVTYVVVIDGTAYEAYVENGTLYIKGNVADADLGGLDIYEADDSTSAASNSETETDSDSSATSTKKTADVATRTVAEVLFLSVCAAGLLLMRRRILSGIED